MDTFYAVGNDWESSKLGNKTYQYPVFLSILECCLYQSKNKYLNFPSMLEFACFFASIQILFFTDSSVTFNFPGCKRYDLCTKRDKGLFVDLVYFQLQDVNLTPEQESRFLKKVLEQERKDTELFKQQEAVRIKFLVLAIIFCECASDQSVCCDIFLANFYI